MERFRIEGGRRLEGTVQISGAKNAALPAMAIALLTSEPVHLENIPRVRDIITMGRLLTHMKVRVVMDEVPPTNVTLQAEEVSHGEAPYELVRTMRASLQTGGVPVVLRDAPLGTYLGWNITAAGFHKGQVCNYAGGMIPFPKTKAERLAAEDPRPSLEERYTDHAGYVKAVEAAAHNAMAAGFLLEADMKKLVAAAQASDVLK